MKKNLIMLLILTITVFYLFSGCSTEQNLLGPSKNYEPAPDYVDPIHLYNYYALHGDEKTFAQYEDALYEYSRNYTYEGLQKLRSKTKQLGLAELFEYIAKKIYNKGVEYYDINYKLTASQYFKKITQKLPGTSYADEALYYIILCDIPFNDYSDIIRAGLDILNHYPESPYKDYALYSISISYYKLKNYDRAKLYFTELTQKYPSSRYTDDAYFWLGEIAFKKQDYSTAYQNYLYIIQNFPSSNYRYSAQTKIDYIVEKNLIAF